VWTAVLLVAGVSVSGCRKQEDANAMPAVAEVDTKPPEVKTKPGEVDVKLGEIKLEDALPLTPDKVGKVLMVNGTVVGAVQPAGFFVKTAQGNHVLFVRSTAPVATGDNVRVVGPLGVGEVAVQKRLQADALKGVALAEFDVIPTFFIDATNVAKV
jgi:hypothetical protein